MTNTFIMIKTVKKIEDKKYLNSKSILSIKWKMNKKDYALIKSDRCKTHICKDHILESKNFPYDVEDEKKQVELNTLPEHHL